MSSKIPVEIPDWNKGPISEAVTLMQINLMAAGSQKKADSMVDVAQCRWERTC
jgi:hypothetical protein